MATEYAGNVIPAPAYRKGNNSTDDELMYSMVGYTQKGVTLKAGQGVLPVGQTLARKTGDKRYYPYNDAGTSGVTNEVQSVALTGTPATGGTFTLTFTGQTTAAIAFNATAATVQAALIALSNVAPGDVVVTGGPGPGTPYTVTFGGAYADTNVAEMTGSGAALTPAGGTVTVTTTVQGNTADGTDVAKGFLRTAVDTGTDATGQEFQGNIVIKGMVKYSKIVGLDANGIADLNGRVDEANDFFSF